MSATLSVELERAAFEKVGADVAFVPFFQDERPLRGSAGRADWRLCGHLSSLLRQGRVAGTRGEAVLVPTAGGLRAPLLVALGAGPRAALDEPTWSELAREVVERALGLRAASVAVALPSAGPGRLGLRPRVEGLLRGAAAGLAQHSPRSLLLRLVVSGDEAVRAADLLESLRLRDLACGITLRLPSGSRRRRPAGAPGTSARP